MNMKEEYKKAMELWAEIYIREGELKKLEEQYESLMENIVPIIWEELGNGINWEKDEKYHQKCPVCNDMAISLLIEARGQM